jgi:hypothetical protein
VGSLSGSVIAVLSFRTELFSVLYRRSPPNPPRLLLRIVATAGTSALLGAAGCGGEVAGSAGNFGSDAKAETQRACGGGLCDGPGFTYDAESHLQCGGGPCGSVTTPPASTWLGGGVMASPDAGMMASPRGGGFVDSGWNGRGPCDGRPCPKLMPSDAGEGGPIDSGAVVSADAGSDVVLPCNGGPCGVILHPEGGLD